MFRAVMLFRNMTVLSFAMSLTCTLLLSGASLWSINCFAKSHKSYVKNGREYHYRKGHWYYRTIGKTAKRQKRKGSRQASKSAPESKSSRGGVCPGRIEFNCDAHYARVGNKTSPLDCGVSTPKSFLGSIQSFGKAAGSRWKCLAGKPMANIGLGPVIIHTPCGNRSPKGQNQTFAHSGCLNISPKFMEEIRGCKGSSYQITYKTKGRRQSPANPRGRAQLSNSLAEK